LTHVVCLNGILALKKQLLPSNVTHRPTGVCERNQCANKLNAIRSMQSLLNAEHASEDCLSVFRGAMATMVLCQFYQRADNIRMVTSM
jgi:hypothetical protein